MIKLDPISPDAWSPRHAMHLLNRAGFGLPFPHVGRLMELPPQDAVALMVDYDAGPDTPAPDFLLAPKSRGELKQEHPDADTSTLQMIYQEYQRAEREAVHQLQAWWLERMYLSPTPLQEKMGLFWHGHFATSAQKVKSSRANHQLYETFRKHATGNFKALTIAVGQSIAMLEYLDNRKSTKAAPNENWARELMELFTLGKGHYSEEDIKASARAFTGWGCDRDKFIYYVDKHDDEDKTFMGRTGRLDGWNIIDIIFEQPACAEFICAKLWRYFAGTEAESDVVQGLAATLREHDYELRPMLRQMFASQAFYAPEVMGAQIKSPVQFVLRLCHDLGMEPPYPQLAKATRALGQDLFYPPNVKGWDGNRAWINANSLLVRCNLPALLMDPRAARKNASVMGAMNTMEVGDDGDGDAMMQMQEAPAQRKGRREKGPREVVFGGLHFATAGQCMTALGTRFLAVPMGPQQRGAMLQVMGVADETAPLTPDHLDQQQRVALLRIVTSMAEYQLC